MGFRFRKTFRVAPGVRLNLSGSGLSLSTGIRGASVNVGTRGIYSNLGIPGTGVSFRTRLDGGSRPKKSAAKVRTQEQISARLGVNSDGTLLFQDQLGHSLPNELIQIAKRQHRDLIKNLLEQECNERNEKTASLLKVHYGTPFPDATITFRPQIFGIPKPQPPYNSHYSVPKAEPPALKSINFLARIFSPYRQHLEAQNRKLLQAYEETRSKAEERQQELDKTATDLTTEYQARLSDWEREYAAFEKEQDRKRQIVEVGRLNDATAMQDYLSERLESVPWPRETHISFQLEEEGRKILMDVDLPEIEEMPSQQAHVSGRDLRLVMKDKPQVQQRADYLMHIHAIGFRIIGEVFASLPTVSTIFLSAYSQRLDKKTYQISDEYLYSTRVSRSSWAKVDFANLNALDVIGIFADFEVRRKITKQGTLSAIQPYTE